MLSISIMVIPMQLLTSMLISRVSSEAAGTLGIIELFYNTILTFFLFGGETAIVKLLSDIKDNEKKKQFTLYYISICVAYFIVFTVVLRLLNIDIIKHVIGSNNNTSITMYIVGAFIVLHNVLLCYQKEQGRFLFYSLGTKLFNFIIFFTTIYIYIFKSTEINMVFYYSMLIGYSFFIPYTVYQMNLRINHIRMIKTSEYKFFKYAVFLHASTIVAFLFDRMDQVFLLNKFDLATLGGYYLVVKIINIVKMIPNIYNSAYYLLFCKELNKENINKLSISLLSRNLLVIIPLSLVLIVNSTIIIETLFGAGYLDYVSVLNLFIVNVVIGSPGIILNNCLFALGKSKQYFIISCFSVVVQFLAMFPLIGLFGIEGLVIARSISSILVIALCLIYLDKMGYKITLSKNYFFYSILVIILFFVIDFYQFSNVIALVFTVVLLGVFIFVNADNYKDLLSR